MSELKTIDLLIDELFNNIPFIFKTFFKQVGERQNPANPENRVLIMLMHHGSQPMSVIGRSLGLGKSYMTAIIDKLIQSGLVVRLPVEVDRRIIKVKLTEKGMLAVEQRRNEIRDVIRGKLKSLSEDEIKTLHDSAENIKVIFKKMIG